MRAELPGCNQTSMAFCLVLIASGLNAAPPNYHDHVLPILKQHCLGCHNADAKKSGLNLSSWDGVSAGGAGGAIVKAGSPNASPLLLAVTHQDGYPAMPPKKPKIPADQIAILRDWIAGGLLLSTDGKSQLRDVAFAVGAGSMQRPARPAFPHNLAAVPLQKTTRSPAILALAVSPWSQLVAVNGHQQILLYGAQTSTAGKPQPVTHLGTLPFPEGDVFDLRFSPNGELLLAAGGIGAESGKVAIYDVRSGRRVATLADEYDNVLTADITADHQTVAIGTPAKQVKIFSTKDGKLLHQIKKHTDWVTVVRFRPDGKQLATADRNGGLYVWDTATAGIAYNLDQHKQKVTALSWRPDGNVLASASEDGTFVLWDMKDGWAVRSVNAHVEPAQSRYSRRTGVLDITFSHDGRLLTVGRDRTLRLWKTDGNPIAKAVGLKSLPLQVQFSPSGATALLGTFDGQLQPWRLKEMKALRPLVPSN